MKQQINLYQPMFRRQEKVFSAKTMLQTIVLFMGVLTIIYFYGNYQLRPLENQLTRLEQDIITLRAQVSRYRGQVPEQSESQLMQAEISRLERQLQQRRQVQQLLQSEQIGEPARFSRLLEALARQHVQGTWLTRIGISGGGTALSLDGRTLASTLVPQYMQRLGEEQVMSGVAFNVLELQQPEGQPGSGDRDEMTFRISTN